MKHKSSSLGAQLSLFDFGVEPATPAQSVLIETFEPAEATLDAVSNAPTPMPLDAPTPPPEANRFSARREKPRAFCGNVLENNDGCRCHLPNLAWESTHFRCADCFGVVPRKRGDTLFTLDNLGVIIDVSPLESEKPRPKVARLERREVVRPVELQHPRCADPREGEQPRAPEVVEVAPDSTKHDLLLDWMSLAGTGSAALLANVARTLELEEVAAHPARFLRRLRLLGHIQTSGDGARWSVNAPALLGTSSGSWILSGARDGLLKTALHCFADVALCSQHGAPSRWLISSDDARALREQLCIELPFHCLPHFVLEASNHLTARLPHLRQWRDSLPLLHGVVPENFEIRHRDDGRWFHVALPDKSGFYEFWPRFDGTSDLPWNEFGAHPKFHALRCSGGTWREGSWYDLHFAGRLENGEKGTLCFNQIGRKLEIPAAWRFPEPFERALVLSSGLLPRPASNSLSYDEVAPSVAQAFSGLGFPIQF